MTSTYYQEYNNLVSSLARDYFPNPDDAEEAMQEVFIKLLTIKEHAPKDKDAWVYRIVDNLLKDLKRKERSTRRTEERAVQHAEDVIDYDDPLTLLEREEAAIIAIENYEALPAIFKEIMELRYTQEMSYDQIASKLGISMGTVASRIARAKEMIQV